MPYKLLKYILPERVYEIIPEVIIKSYKIQILPLIYVLIKWGFMRNMSLMFSFTFLVFKKYFGFSHT